MAFEINRVAVLKLSADSESSFGFYLLSGRLFSFDFLTRRLLRNVGRFYSNWV